MALDEVAAVLTQFGSARLRRLRHAIMQIAGLFIASLLASAPAHATDCSNPYGVKCHVALSTGVDMSYVDQGPRDGPVVLLLHGYTDSSIEWARTMIALARINPALRLVAVDQRGAGGGTTDLPDTPLCRSSPAHCITNADHVADVVAFAHALHLRRIILIGHSMGSVVARGVALADPALVARLVLISTPDDRPAGSVGLAGITALPGPAGGSGPLSVESWQARLAARGIAWPREAFDLRLIDFDPDAVAHLLEVWDTSAVADPDVLRDIAARTAMVRLKYWGIDPAPVSAPAENLGRLSVPTLVLWGVQDEIMTKAMQGRLVATLQQASRHKPGMFFVWKQYGAREPVHAGQQDDIGHEIVSEAPGELARDLDSFIRTGAPTPDLYHAGGPDDLRHIVTEPGRAPIIASASGAK